MLYKFLSVLEWFESNSTESNHNTRYKLWFDILIAFVLSYKLASVALSPENIPIAFFWYNFYYFGFVLIHIFSMSRTECWAGHKFSFSVSLTFSLCLCVLYVKHASVCVEWNEAPVRGSRRILSLKYRCLPLRDQTASVTCHYQHWLVI